jgi:hypothetical protein
LFFSVKITSNFIIPLFTHVLLSYFESPSGLSHPFRFQWPGSPDSGSSSPHW